MFPSIYIVYSEFMHCDAKRKSGITLVYFNSKYSYEVTYMFTKQRTSSMNDLMSEFKQNDSYYIGYYIKLYNIFE